MTLRLMYQGVEFTPDPPGPYGIVEIAAVERIDRAFTLAKKALELVGILYGPQTDPSCECGGAKSQHENGTGACAGLGSVKCACVKFSADTSSEVGNAAAEALAALNELLSPPAKEEPK